MKKLLITGASGFLGWYLCQEALSQGWNVHGTAFSKHPEIKDICLHRLDLTDYDALKALVEELYPDAVIHAAALGRPNECQEHPDASHAINVAATKHLARICGDRACKFVFISTEQVFDGLNPPYRETDPVSPIHVYGEHKAIAEQQVLAIDSNFLGCRMPLMFGAVPHAPSFLQGFLERLQQGKQLSLFVDEIRTPLSGMDAALGILLALEKASGILHLSGTERLSRYEFGQRLVAVMGMRESCLAPCRQSEVHMSAPRPPDLSMESHWAPSLGYSPMLVSEGLQQLIGV